jgi:hypothetical protein
MQRKIWRFLSIPVQYNPTYMHFERQQKVKKKEKKKEERFFWEKPGRSPV